MNARYPRGQRLLGFVPVVLSAQLAGAQDQSICLLPPDHGPCDGVCPRHFYNPETNACEEFVWGCCGGNENNFETAEDCEAVCANAIPAASAWMLTVLALLLATAGTLLTGGCIRANMSAQAIRPT